MTPRRSRMSDEFAVLGSLLGPGTACASEPMHVEEPDVSQAVAFLEEGQTTREDVLLKFGAPAARFEDGRILTYRLILEEEPRVVAPEVSLRDPRIAHWVGAAYSLVLVFDEHNVLARQSLIRVN